MRCCKEILPLLKSPLAPPPPSRSEESVAESQQQAPLARSSRQQPTSPLLHGLPLCLSLSLDLGGSGNEGKWWRSQGLVATCSDRLATPGLAGAHFSRDLNGRSSEWPIAELHHGALPAATLGAPLGQQEKTQSSHPAKFWFPCRGCLGSSK